MLVDVVELRRAGVRLPPEAVNAAQPVRGVLRLDRSRPAWHGRHSPLLALLLTERTSSQVLEPLVDARVVKIARGAMLIVGLQQHVRPIRVYESLQQAWWVRPATV